MFQKKIVITGGLGLIGKELIEFLNKDNYEIIVIDLKGQIKRYKKYINSNRNIKFIACDINSQNF